MPTTSNAATDGHDGRTLRYVKTSANMLILLASGVVLYQNLFLAHRVQQLSQAAAARAYARDVLAPGARLGDIDALGADGKARTLAFGRGDSRHVLIITFSADCGTCSAMEERWRKLTSTLRPTNRWKIVWISRDALEKTKRFATLHRIPEAEVLAYPLYEAASSLKLDAVPQMLVVTAQGLVTKAWGGTQPWTEADVIAAADSRGGR